MKSELDIQRFIRVLKTANHVESYNMIKALTWVLGENSYPTDRDLIILEETYKENK